MTEKENELTQETLTTPENAEETRVSLNVKEVKMRTGDIVSYVVKFGEDAESQMYQHKIEKATGLDSEAYAVFTESGSINGVRNEIAKNIVNEVKSRLSNPEIKKQIEDIYDKIAKTKKAIEAINDLGEVNGLEEDDINKREDLENLIEAKKSECIDLVGTYELIEKHKEEQTKTQTLEKDEARSLADIRANIEELKRQTIIADKQASVDSKTQQESKLNNQRTGVLNKLISLFK